MPSLSPLAGRGQGEGQTTRERRMSEIQALVHDVFGTVVDWRGAYAPSMNRVRTGELPWTNLDALHRMGLDTLLEKFGIAGRLGEDDKDWFNLTWHRLKPWPDSVPGLTRIKRQYIIATLSN